MHNNNAHVLADCRFTHYVVVTRDPVARTVSAFNFRHPIGGNPGHPYMSPAELVLYTECFPALPGGVNAFAESLAEEGRCGDIARTCLHEPSAGCLHLSKGHGYYLLSSGLMPLLRRPDKHAFAVRTESLEDDMPRLWEWLCMEDQPLAYDHVKARPRTGDTALSDAGRAALVAQLGTEFYAKATVEALADSSPRDKPANLYTLPVPQTAAWEVDPGVPAGTGGHRYADGVRGHIVADRAVRDACAATCTTTDHRTDAGGPLAERATADAEREPAPLIPTGGGGAGFAAGSGTRGVSK